MSEKVKTSLRLANPSDVASFLRMVADRIEGVENQSEPFALGKTEGFSKIELEIKKEELGAYRLKMNAKVPVVEEEDLEIKSGQLKPDLKELRKRMDKAFKDIKESLYKNTLPAELAVTSFLNDSELITADEAEEYAPAFKAACTELETAFEQKDIENLIGAFAKIKSLKDTRHDLF